MFVFLSSKRQLFFSSLVFVCFMFLPEIGHSKIKTISYHTGGKVSNVYMEVHRAVNQGTRIKVTGRCMSACTLYLVSDKVCVTRGASFKFHQAQFGNAPRKKARPNLNGTRFLMEQYPARLRNWITLNGGLPWHGWLTLNANTAVRYGFAKYC